MSLGGVPSFSLHRAIRRAVAADVIVLAAAGNCVGLVVWPARYDDCIAVAGTDSTDRPWRGTSHGSAVDVSAPGQNVIRAQVTRGDGSRWARARAPASPSRSPPASPRSGSPITGGPT